MPTYQYKCTDEKCGKVKNEHRRIEDRGYPSVCECGTPALKVFTSPATIIPKHMRAT